jgi:hypothetical protein
MAINKWKVEMIITDEYLSIDEPMTAKSLAEEIRGNWDRSAGIEIEKLNVKMVSKGPQEYRERPPRIRKGS